MDASLPIGTYKETYPHDVNHLLENGYKIKDFKIR